MPEHEKLEWADKKWWPQEFAIVMAFDAFRIALGGKPSRFTVREIKAWLDARVEAGLR